MIRNSFFKTDPSYLGKRLYIWIFFIQNVFSIHSQRFAPNRKLRTIEILEQGVKNDHVKHKKPCSTVFAIDTERAIVCQVKFRLFHGRLLLHFLKLKVFKYQFLNSSGICSYRQMKRELSRLNLLRRKTTRSMLEILDIIKVRSKRFGLYT